MKHKFTNQIKQAWLEALKSGKFTQAAGCLTRGKDMENSTRAGHCCIGVLGEITPFLSVKSLRDEKNDPYNFLENTIGRPLVTKLYNTNDSTYDYDKPDYSNVLELIESLPVQD